MGDKNRLHPAVSQDVQAVWAAPVSHLPQHNFSCPSYKYSGKTAHQGQTFKVLHIQAKVSRCLRQRLNSPATFTTVLSFTAFKTISSPGFPQLSVTISLLLFCVLMWCSSLELSLLFFWDAENVTTPSSRTDFIMSLGICPQSAAR